MNEAVLYESHCHTPLCRHAEGEPTEYAARALERGLAGINITCHGPTPREWGHCMRQDEWPEYLRIVNLAREEFAGQLDVKVGIECDYMPGMEDYWKRFLGRNELSHVLGSVHPQVGEYRQKYWHGNAMDYQRTYFDHLARAAESGLFDTLSHPDLVKNSTPRDWDLEAAMPFITKSLDRIAATGVCMELNTSGLNKVIREMNPAPGILREMSARGIPVVVGADAHVPERVADRFEQALELLEECGYSEISFFVDRQQRTVGIPVAMGSLKEAASGPGG